jgi:hypothetical protein
MTREDFDKWAKARGLTTEEACRFYKVVAKLERERRAALRLAKTAVREFGDPKFVRQLDDRTAKS